VVKQQLSASRAVAFPSDRVRSLFPALNQKPAFIFDNADGAQIPQVVFDAIHRHLPHRSVQVAGSRAWP
jgi:selenocysteine lyase/cysteine desulfurase